MLPCATICSRPSTLMELLYECVSCFMSSLHIVGTLHSPCFLSKLLIDESEDHFITHSLCEWGNEEREGAKGTYRHTKERIY